MGSLSAGTTVKLIFDHIMINSTGSKQVKATADYGNGVSESNEANNNQVKNWDWSLNPALKPDLIINNVSGQLSIIEKEQINVTVEVSNFGLWSTIQTCNAEIMENGVSTWNVTIPILEKNEKCIFNITKIIPQSGEYNYSIKIDSLNEINELDETNNFNSTLINVSELITNDGIENSTPSNSESDGNSTSNNTESDGNSSIDGFSPYLLLSGVGFVCCVIIFRIKKKRN